MFNQSTTRFSVGLFLGLCAEASVLFVVSAELRGRDEVRYRWERYAERYLSKGMLYLPNDLRDNSRLVSRYKTDGKGLNFLQEAAG